MKSLLSSSLVLLGSASLAPAAITLVDASFESNDIGANGAALNGANATWPGVGCYLVDNTSGSQWFNGNATGGGFQSLSLANGYISQQLNDNVDGAIMTSSTAGKQFDISFYVGRRLGATSGLGTFSVLLQAYNGSSVEGNLAQQMFCIGSDTDVNTIDLNLGAGQWSSNAINLSLTTALDPTASNIRLVFAENNPFGSNGAGGEAAIDNVSIALVPEPSAALLGGLGLLALLRRRR